MHYGQDYDNAFWDGSRMVFGDGDGEVFARFTISLGVIAHELAHGFTQYTTPLEYKDQAGALNESVSDVFGALVEQYTAKQNAEDASWLIGEGLFLPAVQGKLCARCSSPAPRTTTMCWARIRSRRVWTILSSPPRTRAGCTSIQVFPTARSPLPRPRWEVRRGTASGRSGSTR